MSYSWFVKALVASQSAKNGISSTGPSLFNYDVTVDGAVITKANVVLTALSTTTTSLDAADLVNGYYTTTSSWSSGTHNITLPDASEIIAVIPNCQEGSSFKFTINNTSGQTATLVAGADSDVTLGSGVAGASTNGTVRTFLVVATTSSTVNVYLM